MYSGRIGSIAVPALAISMLMFTVYASADALVSSGTGVGTTSIISFENDGDSDVGSFRLWLGSGDSFKSFKTEHGWTGERNLEGEMVFSPEDPQIFRSRDLLEPGESVKFGIKTNIPMPNISWEALGPNSRQVDSGNITVKDLGVPDPPPEPPPVVEPPTPPEPPSPDPDPSPAPEPPLVDDTIRPDAAFSFIPSEPNVGATVRVTGEGFGINNNLELFMDSTKLESFQSDQNGEFIITTTIPNSASADRVNFVVRDDKGGEKTVSLRLGQPASRIPPSEAELTVDGLPSIIYRGDTLTLSGTAEPGSTVTALVTTPSDVIIRANSTQVGSDGRWSEEYTVPVNAELGTYVAEITDDQSSIIREFIVETSDTIQLTPIRLQFEPGDLIVFNGTATPNQPLEWTLEDPKGIDIHSESIDVGADGQVSISFQTELSNIKGTYILFATQGEHTGISQVGLGQSPDELIIATMDRLNYNAGDDAVITIEGPPLSSISLIVISPTGQNMFARSEPGVNGQVRDNPTSKTIEIGREGRAEYVLDLTGYKEGIYTASLSRGSTQVVVEFGIGLKTSTKFIDLNIAKTEYMRGDALMIHGATLQNLQQDEIKAKPDKHVLLTIYVIDPAGGTFKEIDTFSDGSGLFVESVRIPADAEYGRWTVSVRSDKGLPADCQIFSSACYTTLKDTEFNVIPSPDERRMVIIVEEVGKEIVSIRVVGVGPDLMVSIISPFGEELESIEPHGSNGEAHIPWLVPPEFIPGQYTVRATDIYGNATATFELSDFT